MLRVPAAVEVVGCALVVEYAAKHCSISAWVLRSEILMSSSSSRNRRGIVFCTSAVTRVSGLLGLGGYSGSGDTKSVKLMMESGGGGGTRRGCVVGLGLGDA